MDARELSNFFTSRGADRECPICGYDGEWARIEADGDLKLNTINGLGMVPVAAVLCRNCGFVRLHAVDAVRHRLMDGGEETSR